MKLPKQDPKYGKVIKRVGVEDERHSYVVSLLKHRGRLVLDIRNIWYQDGKPRFGKGIRIPVNSTGEEVLLAAQALFNAGEEGDE